MLRDIIRLSNEKGCAWITTPKGGAEEFIESLKGTVKGLEAKVYAAGKVPLADLPEDVQQKVRDILRAFDECHVEYENSVFHSYLYVLIYAIILRRSIIDYFEERRHGPLCVSSFLAASFCPLHVASDIMNRGTRRDFSLHTFLTRWSTSTQHWQ